jgi:hypothetical protein
VGRKALSPQGDDDDADNDGDEDKSTRAVSFHGHISTSCPSCTLWSPPFCISEGNQMPWVCSTSVGLSKAQTNGTGQYLLDEVSPVPRLKVQTPHGESLAKMASLNGWEMQKIKGADGVTCTHP